MADRNDGSIAPRRGLGGPILPPPPEGLGKDTEKAEAKQRAAEEKTARKEAGKKAAVTGAEHGKQAAEQSRPAATRTGTTGTSTTGTTSGGRPKPAPRRTRRAQLRLVQVDAWSVMKTSFLLSIALGIVLVVAVAIIWSVIGAAGVWESINAIVQQAVGNPDGQPFDIRDYVGTSRVLGFTMVVAVVDVILITAIATLGAFLYNLSAALLGGIEVTLAEDH